MGPWWFHFFIRLTHFKQVWRCLFSGCEEKHECLMETQISKTISFGLLVLLRNKERAMEQENKYKPFWGHLSQVFSWLPVGMLQSHSEGGCHGGEGTPILPTCSPPAMTEPPTPPLSSSLPGLLQSVLWRQRSRKTVSLFLFSSLCRISILGLFCLVPWILTTRNEMPTPWN